MKEVGWRFIMLGMLTVGNTKRHWIQKMTTAQRYILGVPILEIEVSKYSPRTVRRCARELMGLRVIVPDSFPLTEECRKKGMVIVEGKTLYPRIAQKIIHVAMQQLHISAHSAAVIVSGGRMDRLAQQMICELAYEARFLCITCPGCGELRDELSMEYGVSVLCEPPPDQMVETYLELQLNRDSMSLKITQHDRVLIFDGASIQLPDALATQVRDDQRNSLAAAFLQNGLLRISDMKVESVLFNNSKN